MFSNLSDNTVRAVVENLSLYLPAPHLEALLRVLDTVVDDAVTQAAALIPDAG